MSDADAQVLALVREALSIVLQVDPSGVDRSTTLDELDIDSLALVELAEIVEERLSADGHPRFRIEDEDLENFRTVGDAVDYVVKRL